MKRFATLTFIALALFVSNAFAQMDSTTLKREGWSYGVFAGYGNGVGENSFFRRYTAGARLGRVLTGEYGPGLLRGTLEWNAELTPVDVLDYRGASYAFGGDPLILKWNFTQGHKRVVPFFEAVGGLLFTPDNFPPGDTSTVNFRTGAGVGFHGFTSPKRAITFSIRAMHISNASIGNSNPGINAHIQFLVGYTWFK